jgi:hypothetical protein
VKKKGRRTVKQGRGRNNLAGRGETDIQDGQRLERLRRNSFKMEGWEG